jgi:hypothetical protein
VTIYWYKKARFLKNIINLLKAKTSVINDNKMAIILTMPIGKYIHIMTIFMPTSFLLIDPIDCVSNEVYNPDSSVGR